MLNRDAPRKVFMSPPKLQQLKFWLEHNDDEELSCFFCTAPKCDQKFTASGAGTSRNIGVHKDCANKHEDKMHPKLSEPAN